MDSKVDEPSTSGRFFLVVPIGLEERAHRELRDWCTSLATVFGGRAFLLSATVVKGGVEFEIDEAVGLLLNRCLKLPSRILQRVHIFETRDWAEVKKQMSKVPWKRFFSQGISDWEIAASESRMNNEKHLRTFIEDHFAGKSYQKASVVDSGSGGAVAYLRVHNNVFTLSRDTSGEHLHFRGYRKQQGEAPLRENLAAFLWSCLLEGRSRLECEQTVIVDPFCGSGTLLVEAALWNCPVKGRDFAADAWIPKSDEVLWRQVERRLQPWKLNLFGVDCQAEVLEKAQDNLKRALGDDSKVTWVCEDSTANSKPAWVPADKSVWLISNPPYGGKGRLASEKSWKELWLGALNRYRADVAVGLGPERDARKGDSLGAWQCLETHRFLNGGLRVVASLWKHRR